MQWRKVVERDLLFVHILRLEQDKVSEGGTERDRVDIKQTALNQTVPNQVEPKLNNIKNRKTPFMNLSTKYTHANKSRTTYINVATTTMTARYVYEQCTGGTHPRKDKPTIHFKNIVTNKLYKTLFCRSVK